MLGGNCFNGIVLHKWHDINGSLHVKLDKRGRAEGAIGGDRNALSLSELDEFWLDKVGMVLDLQGGWWDLRVAKEVVEQLSLEVGYANTPSEALANEPLHSSPRLLYGGLGGTDLLLTIVVPAWGISHRGIDILKSDGKVN